jgi:hypothetical protein
MEKHNLNELSDYYHVNDASPEADIFTIGKEPVDKKTMGKTTVSQPKKVKPLTVDEKMIENMVREVIEKMRNL